MTELNPPTTWANCGIAGLPVIAVAKGRVEPLLLPERPLRKAGAAVGGPPPGQQPVGAGAGSDAETWPGGSRT